MSKLVIVESPAKAKTIKKYLGDGYQVIASMGHVRDLPKSQIGIDIDNDFKPRYINIPGKSKLIRELKDLSRNSETVYLATDPDREGEAISWHLAHILKLDTTEQNRVTFGEITKKGITEGMANKRTIDGKARRGRKPHLFQPAEMCTGAGAGTGTHPLRVQAGAESGL